MHRTAGHLVTLMLDSFNLPQTSPNKLLNGNIRHALRAIRDCKIIVDGFFTSNTEMLLVITEIRSVVMRSISLYATHNKTAV